MIPVPRTATSHDGSSHEGDSSSSRRRPRSSFRVADRRSPRDCPTTPSARGLARARTPRPGQRRRLAHRLRRQHVHRQLLARAVALDEDSGRGATHATLRPVRRTTRRAAGPARAPRWPGSGPSPAGGTSPRSHGRGTGERTGAHPRAPPRPSRASAGSRRASPARSAGRSGRRPDDPSGAGNQPERCQDDHQGEHCDRRPEGVLPAALERART